MVVQMLVEKEACAEPFRKLSSFGFCRPLPLAFTSPAGYHVLAAQQ